MRRLFFTVLLVIALGCSRSGTWEDDPKNFERAFRQRPHEAAVIVHSWYWRSPHWTYEFAYFFQFRANESFQKFLFDNNKLKQPDSQEDYKRLANDLFAPKPSWFLPKSVVEYELWIYADKPESRFRIFIDRQNRDIFVTDYSF